VNRIKSKEEGLVRSGQLDECGWVVGATLEIRFAFDVKAENSLLSQFGGETMKGLRVLGHFDGSLKADQGKFVNRFLVESFGDFLVAGSGYCHGA
jgi:hypothetical protein